MPRLVADGVSRPIQAILFDKDGTLLDFVYTWGYWGERLLARFSLLLEERKLPPLAMDLSELWGVRRNAENQITGYDRNGPLAMGTVDELLTILAWQGYRLGLSWAEAKLVAEDSRQHADDKLEQFRVVRLMPEVVLFLEQCRRSGVLMAVVTADETKAAAKHLEWLGISHYFSACVGTDRVERGKPFPDMVELACRELSLSPRQIAVIGDTNGDMLMAKSAGAAVAIGITSPEASGKESLPDADAIISSYRELAVSEDG